MIATILPGCRDALCRLRTAWELVAVTARWGGVPRCRTNTELWLEANGIPMPTYYAPRPIPSDAPRAEFKAGVIARLLDERGGSSDGGVFAVGVGDRPSDMRAYVRNGLHALVITDALGEVSGRHLGFARCAMLASLLAVPHQLPPHPWPRYDRARSWARTTPPCSWKVGRSSKQSTVLRLSHREEVRPSPSLPRLLQLRRLGPGLPQHQFQRGCRLKSTLTSLPSSTG